MAWERETKIKRNSKEDEEFEGVKLRMRDEKSKRERRSLRERIEFFFYIFFWSVKMMRMWHVSFLSFCT